MLERYVIHVTKECNMDCFYCYEKDKTSRYTKEEIVALVEKIASECHEDMFGIEFLGGEPLMAFENIKTAYEYLETNYAGRVSDYVITTNGSILTDEILSFLKEHENVVYAVSMDGTKWANQFRRFKNGKNSFEVVVENLKTAMKELGEKQVCVHVVTHPFNVGNLFNSIHFLYNLGIRSIGVGTVESTMDIDDRYCNRFVAEMNLVSQWIILGIFSGLSIDVLEVLKPKNDVRTYIRDPKTNKVVGESYGRAKNDITSTNAFNSVQTYSPIGDVIYSLRECVYLNHKYRKAAAAND